MSFQQVYYSEWIKRIFDYLSYFFKFLKPLDCIGFIEVLSCNTLLVFLSLYHNLTQVKSIKKETNREQKNQKTAKLSILKRYGR